MAEPRVVNLRDFRRQVGMMARTRWAIVLPPDVVRVDRASVWGNPVALRDFPGLPPMARRAAAIDAYRLNLEVLLADNPAFLDPLRGKRLACWCAPLPCHGDVILEVLDRG